MMKTTILHASLLVSLAPLALACVEPAPIDDADATAAFAAAGDDEAVDTAESALKKPKKPRIFPRQSSPYGKSYEEWAAKWWQWSLAVPASVNPMLGGPCDVDQSGKVFFLAGTMGGESERECTIPKNKALFFPLVNGAYANCPEYANDTGYTCEVSMSEDNLQACIDWFAGQTFDVSLEVDGVAADNLEDYSVYSDTFTVPGPEDPADKVWACSGVIGANSCGVEEGTERLGITGGYWVMLKPLPPGQHELHFTGTVTYEGGSSFGVDVTYDLTVQH